MPEKRSLNFCSKIFKAFQGTVQPLKTSQKKIKEKINTYNVNLN